MNKLFMTACVAAFASVALTGCLPQTRSVGFSLMPTPLTHRSNGDDEHSYVSFTGDGFYGHTGTPSEDVQNVNIGGANVGVTRHFGGFFSPFFVNAALGFFGGYSGFACFGSACDDGLPEDSWFHDSNESYKAWLETAEGKDTYSTWGAQERLILGFDFTPGQYVIWGFSLGVQGYQEGGDYKQVRYDLDKNDVAADIDGEDGLCIFASVWFGSYLGLDGKYGNFVAQMDLGDWAESTTGRWMFTYTHPSGFFVGYQYGTVVSHSFYFGKEFVF